LLHHPTLPLLFVKAHSLWKLLREPILHTFNSSFQQGTFSSSLTLVNLVCFPKPSKDSDKYSIKNFQISQQRVYYFCERNKILTSSKFAFRKNHSSIDPLILLAQDIHSGLTRPGSYHSFKVENTESPLPQYDKFSQKPKQAEILQDASM
jgi:hypothetical protein